MTIAAGCLFFLESNQSSSLGKLHAGDIIKAELKVPVYCHFSKIFVFPTVLSLFLNQNCKSSLLFSDVLVFIIMIGGCWPFVFR